MFGLLGLGAGSTFSASFVDCAVPCLQSPNTKTTEKTKGNLGRDVRRSRTESTLESPPKTAYRFLGMAPPWPPTRRGNARRTETHGPVRLHPREPGRDRQCPRDYPGPVGGDPRRPDHLGRDPRRARGGVDRDGGRRPHLDPGPTAALPEPGRPGAAGGERNSPNRTARSPRDRPRG